MVRKIFLVFVVLASVFSFQPATAAAPKVIAATEVVLIERQEQVEEKAVPFAVKPVALAVTLSQPETLPGVRSTRHLIECLQHHSSLSCC